MFSGIIEGLCEVREARRGSEGMTASIDLGTCSGGVRIGDSIAVNGTCLTVTSLAGNVADFDMVAETLSRTTLGQLRKGSRVNIERSLQIGDRLHGHFVQGHVDGIGKVVQFDRGPEGGEITIEAPAHLLAQMIFKGSIAVDGISLTIMRLEDQSFSIALIPHTLSVTTLGTKVVGEGVNLEVDMIGKWVRKLLPGQEQGGQGSRVTLEQLRAGGFA